VSSTKFSERISDVGEKVIDLLLCSAGDNMVSVGKNLTGHREKLPCPKPNTEGLSLWSLLRKNIGVDLSRVSMPVALNEPLNMLQVGWTAKYLLYRDGE